jgi:putative tricarboxylic transport membrane protein
MKQYDIYCGLFLLATAIFVIGASLKMGLGDVGSPKPGFFPFLVGFLLFFLSLGIIILALKERHKDPTFKERSPLRVSVLLTLAVLIVYAISLEFLGYIVGSSFLFLYLFKVPAEKKWVFSIFMAIVVVSLSYYIFGVLLQAQFPKGIFHLG